MFEINYKMFQESISNLQHSCPTQTLCLLTMLEQCSFVPLAISTCDVICSFKVLKSGIKLQSLLR